MAKLKSAISSVKKTSKMKDNMAPFEKAAEDAKRNAAANAAANSASGSGSGSGDGKGCGCGGGKVIVLSPPPQGMSPPSPAMFGG